MNNLESSNNIYAHLLIQSLIYYVHFTIEAVCPNLWIEQCLPSHLPSHACSNRALGFPTFQNPTFTSTNRLCHFAERAEFPPHPAICLLNWWPFTRPGKMNIAIAYFLPLGRFAPTVLAPPNVTTFGLSRPETRPTEPTS